MIRFGQRLLSFLVSGVELIDQMFYNALMTRSNDCQPEGLAMPTTKHVVWTWCPKCMVRTKHQPVNSGFLCLDCGCLHNGEAVRPAPQKRIEVPQPAYEPAHPGD